MYIVCFDKDGSATKGALTQERLSSTYLSQPPPAAAIYRRELAEEDVDELYKYVEVKPVDDRLRRISDMSLLRVVLKESMPLDSKGLFEEPVDVGGGKSMVSVYPEQTQLSYSHALNGGSGGVRITSGDSKIDGETLTYQQMMVFLLPKGVPSTKVRIDLPAPSTSYTLSLRRSPSSSSRRLRRVAARRRLAPRAPVRLALRAAATPPRTARALFGPPTDTSAPRSCWGGFTAEAQARPSPRRRCERGPRAWLTRCGLAG